MGAVVLAVSRRYFFPLHEEADDFTFLFPFISHLRRLSRRVSHSHWISKYLRYRFYAQVADDFQLL